MSKTYPENEVDAKTMTAWQSSEGKNCSHLVCLTLRPELEAGLILNGKLYPANGRRILTEIGADFWKNNCGKPEHIRECGEFLGEKLALLMEIMNPERIIIEADAEGRDEDLVRYAMEAAKLRCLDDVFQSCRVFVCPADQRNLISFNSLSDNA